MAEYFNDLGDLNNVDWDLLNRKDFRHDPDNPGKKERYQAEALIWKHLPVRALLGICSFNATTDNWVKSQLVERHLNVKTVIEKGWYF